MSAGEEFQRHLEGDVWLHIRHMHTALYYVCVGDRYGYENIFCYHGSNRAHQAWLSWDGKGDAPVGWFRHIDTGRRRTDGDPDKEYYQP